jgi:hypothetical protein
MLTRSAIAALALIVAFSLAFAETPTDTVEGTIVKIASA